MGSELQPLIQSLVFQDIDEPADRIGQFRWNMVHRQIEGGAFEGDLLVSQLAGMQFARLSYSRGIRSWGDSPPGTIALAVPLSPPETLNWHGHSLTTDHVILQKSSHGIDFLRRGRFQHALVVIDTASLLHAANVTNQPDAESLILGNALMFQPDETALRRFQHHLQILFTLSQKYPQRALRPAMQTFIRQEAITLMLNLLTSNDPTFNKSTPEHHPSSRCQLMKHAEEMMLEDLDRPWTVHDLCTALHVSERTLRYGFREYFGLSPMTYLKVQRLNAVRRQLKESTANQVTVTDVAVQWGFWHMGQFAKDYKQMFGECPSETLRRAV